MKGEYLKRSQYTFAELNLFIYFAIALIKRHNTIADLRSYHIMKKQ